MSLADEAKAIGIMPGPRCTTCALLDTDLGPELQEALDDPSIMGTAIAKALKARGVQLSDQSVNRHRRGGCDPRR